MGVSRRLGLIRGVVFAAALVVVLSVTACSSEPGRDLERVPVNGVAAALVDGARSQIGKTTEYDPAYVAIDYPGGNVPLETGVCSDVVVRAYRRIGVDLQQLLHEDMRANFSAYPKAWGLAKPDPNIDHRRVLNLATFLARRGGRLAVTPNASDYRPGNVVTWKMNGRPHTGIVSDVRKKGTDRFLILNNRGRGTRLEDVLFRWPINGHYRWLPRT